MLLRRDALGHVSEHLQNWDDAERYMEGSAAVIGDFMLPLLMASCSAEEMDAARPHAKGLGRAFQLTNFSRDIDEDIDIQRQYIPVEKHGVDLQVRHPNQPGFRDMIDKCTRGATNTIDQGISARDCIEGASHASSVPSFVAAACAFTAIIAGAS